MPKKLKDYRHWSVSIATEYELLTLNVRAEDGSDRDTIETMALRAVAALGFGVRQHSDVREVCPRF